MGGTDALVGGMWVEVVEGCDAEDDVRKGSGNLRVLHVCYVAVAVDVEVMNFSLEGFVDLASGTGEVDYEAALRDAVDLEAMIREPPRDFTDVCWIGAEFLAEFVGGEPVVEVGVAGLMHVVNQLLECGFTIGGPLELKEHVLHFETFVALAAIVEGIGLVADVAGQGDHPGFIDRSRDQGSCVEGRLSMGGRRHEKNWRCKAGAASHCAEQTGTFHRVPPEVLLFLNLPGEGPTARRERATGCHGEPVGES